MKNTAAELVALLASRAEDVCRHYLPSGRRNGRYWQVGDVMNAKRRSLYVRLFGPTSGPGAAGKWTDASTGEHGDLLDLIRLNQQHRTLAETLDEARAFLGAAASSPPTPPAPVPRNSRAAARRLFAVSTPIAATLAELYLRRRGIGCDPPSGMLRYHPTCYYRESDDAPRETWPALIAAITDLSGTLTGVHRTWLARDGRDKAPFEEPRKALGDLLGHAVRIGKVADVLCAGEGLETMLSIRTLLPTMPIAAACPPATCPSVLALPAGLARLYIAVDNDIAGARAAATLKSRAADVGIDASLLIPSSDDWNSASSASAGTSRARAFFPSSPLTTWVGISTLHTRARCSKHDIAPRNN